MAKVIGALKREKVYEHLKNQIITHQFKSGERLSERNLSQKFGVARATVRESLVRLVDDGFLDSVPGRGSFVKTYDPQQVDELFYIREVLEGVAAKSATAKINRIEATQLKLLIDQLEEAYETRQYKIVTKLDMAFHCKVVELSRNDILNSMVHHSFGLKLMITGDDIMPRTALAEHRMIAEAIIGGDAKKAEELMRAHIAGGVETLLKVSGQEGWNV